MPDKRAQTLIFSEPVAQFLRDEGNRQDRSLSFLVQLAWKRSVSTIAAAPARATLDTLLAARAIEKSDVRSEHKLYFPEPMLQEIVDHSHRFDTSLSWVVQCAIVLARDEIEQQPSVTELEAAEDE